MQRLTRARTVLALALVGALALAGCGGDDNNGVEQDLRDQVAMLEGQLSDAETAKAAADAAKMTAEAAATDAMTAQTAAEAERAAANTAKGAAEQAQTTAEAAQMTAEEAQMAAEATQMTAEAAQAEAEKMQAAAEAERDAASGSLAAAEMARDAAKDAEAAAKVAQAHAEAAKMSAEADSADAMAAQMAAEAAQMVAEEAQMAAEASQTAADAKAAEYKMMADDATAAQAAADGKAAEYKMMADDAETARMAAVETQTAADAKAAEYKMMADDAEAARMVAVEAQKDAEAKAEMYKDQLAALRGEMGTDDMMAASAAAEALLDVLAMNQVDVGNNSGLAAPTDAERNDVSNLMVEVSNDGMLIAEVEGDDDYTMSDMVPDMIEGWRGAMLTRDNADGTMDTVVVYTDIGNDGTRTLLDRYVSNLPTGNVPRSWSIGDTGQVPWSQVRRPDEMTSASGPSGDPTTLFMGSVHGIPGTFSCNAVDAALCVSPPRYSDGKVDAVEDVIWMFVPDEGAPTYTDDPSYLAFGWWLDKNAGGTPEDALVFATATGFGDARTDVSTMGTALRGDATYKGGAAGKYAIASTSDASHEGGHFTADATLMVDFDDEVGRDGIALSGMIDNFMTGSTARSDWMVELMVDGVPTPDDGETDVSRGIQSLANLGTAIVDDSLTTEWSTGSAAKGAGEWSVTFHGGDNDPANAGINHEENTALPMAAVGTFNAHIGTADADAGAIARLQGAFGVMREME